MEVYQFAQEDDVTIFVLAYRPLNTPKKKEITPYSVKTNHFLPIQKAQTEKSRLSNR